MSSGSRTTAYAVAILVGSYCAANADQYLPPGAMYSNGSCPQGPGGYCAPKRVTYGYYPTLWRRWPTEQPTKAPKEEPEPIPAKPEKPEAPVEDAKPADETPPIDAASPPAAREPTIPVLPFGDTPPGPPQESNSTPETSPPALEPPSSSSQDEPPAPPAETATPKPSSETDPPEPPSESEPAPAKSGATAPGTLDDDPFKDELPGGTKPPAAPPSKQSKRPPAPPEALQPAPWHSASKTGQDVDEVSQAKMLPREAEPRRLQRVEPSDEGGPTILPASARNPLRSASTKSRNSRAVTAATWAAQPDASTASSAGWQRNPLRSN